MMMLMLARRVDAARAAFRSRVIGEPIGSELHGKQLGIIGLGNSGKCLAAAAQGMGMKVGGARRWRPAHLAISNWATGWRLLEAGGWCWGCPGAGSAVVLRAATSCVHEAGQGAACCPAALTDGPAAASSTPSPSLFPSVARWPELGRLELPPPPPCRWWAPRLAAAGRTCSSWYPRRTWSASTAP
jgi:hypothetical protein